MKVFHVIRKVDVSGVSGVGKVAEAVMFENGKVVLGWSSNVKSVEVFDNLGNAIHIHGHGGATEFVERVELNS